MHPILNLTGTIAATAVVLGAVGGLLAVMRIPRQPDDRPKHAESRQFACVLAIPDVVAAMVTYAGATTAIGCTPRPVGTATRPGLFGARGIPDLPFPWDAK